MKVSRLVATFMSVVSGVLMLHADDLCWNDRNLTLAQCTTHVDSGMEYSVSDEESASLLSTPKPTVYLSQISYPSASKSSMFSTGAELILLVSFTCLSRLKHHLLSQEKTTQIMRIVRIQLLDSWG